MKKIKKSEQVLLVILLGVAIVFFFMKKVYDPLTKSYKTLVKTNNGLVARINDLKGNPVETDYIKKSISNSEKDYSKVKLVYDTLFLARFTDRNHIQEAAVEVSGMISDNGLIVREMSVFDNDTSSAYYTSNLSKWKKSFGLTSYSIKVEGDYLDFISFFSEIVEYERLLIAGNIKIKGINDQGYITASCTMLF